MHIQNGKYWEVKFLTSVFQAGNSRKIYQKRRISMCCNSSCTGQKLMKWKVSTNLIFTFPSNLLIFIIDHAESCFFFLSLTHFFITATYRFSTGPARARKQYVCTKTCFSFKIKDQIILFELEGILKNNLRLLKTLLVCHSAITSTKWQNMKAIPTLILLEDISIKIVGRGLLYS